MNPLSNLLKRNNSPGEAEILNHGIRLAMEFGENWLQPIQNRLAKKFTHLNATELDAYNHICRGAMDSAHSHIYNTLAKLDETSEKIASRELKKNFREYMRNNYTWISGSNLTRLFNQGMYYAWKDGLDKSIV
jgi:hypothetical protein